MLDAYGDSILTYKKQHRFPLEHKGAKYFEPLEDADHNLYVLHIDGVGRLGIIICADIFKQDMMLTLLECYHINCLLVLAYSPGYGRFFDQISQAQRTSCEVVWCNTCAAYGENSAGKPCVAYWSYGHKDRECIKENNCGKVSPDECAGCAFEIEIASGHSKMGKITRKVFE